MGGSYQETIIEATTVKELRTKYSDLVQHHLFMDGHGGYTGTFAEKGQLRVIPGDWEKEAAYEHCLDKNEKWGPSYAYKLLKEGQWYVGGWCSS